MEDVVVHYRPGSAADLSSLLQRTETLLESFPCRTPPVFSAWFPAAADRHPPIRPARAAPVISCSSETRTHAAPRETPCPAKPRGEVCGDRKRTRAGRSWTVSSHGHRVLLDATQSLSRSFLQLVSAHQLHLRQRVKWVIGRHTCGASRDLEQVWQALSRSVQSCRLPSCNANIQRERAEIWVFCDVLHAERVGRSLKEELQLPGTIRLSAHGRGDIFSF
ncbi:uncharacterized protein V6R79_006536 [Siganus canaliculatus]